MLIFWLIRLFGFISLVLAATKDKPHPHNGVLQPFDGKHISYTITAEQNKKLNSGKPVSNYYSFIVL
jgi:hypothetical protein